MIVEPIQSEGGDNFASAEFFQGLRDITNRVSVHVCLMVLFNLYGALDYTNTLQPVHSKANQRIPICCASAIHLAFQLLIFIFSPLNIVVDSSKFKAGQEHYTYPASNWSSSVFFFKLNH